MNREAPLKGVDEESTVRAMGEPFEDWGSSTKWSQGIWTDLRGKDQEDKHRLD